MADGEVDGVDELRRAVQLLSRNREDFNQRHTAEELLAIARACWASEWDVWPDKWTDEQVAAAIRGIAPKFREGRFGLHALDVTDCRCRDCEHDAWAAHEPNTYGGE